MATVAQAGGVVFKSDQAAPRVLLVKARRNPNLWIFPKGHIERGETASETALRETREEAGAVGDLIGRVGSVKFVFQGETIHVEYYLVRWIADVHSPEGRDRKWCTVEEATELLEFEDARLVLSNAARKWNDEPRDRVSHLP